MAKTFTLPDVQVGSILEYYYTTDLSEQVIVNSHWILSNELFTKERKVLSQAVYQRFSSG
jgi:hypothetical protein